MRDEGRLGRFLGFGMIGTFVLLHLLTLTRLPNPHGDETGGEMIRAHFVNVTGARGPLLIQDLYSQRFAFLRDSTLGDNRRLYTNTLAAAFRCLGTGLWQARIVSLASAALLLGLFFYVAKAEAGAMGALMGLAFLAVEPVFGLNAHIARPEMFLAVAGFAAFALWREGRRRDRPFLIAAAGVLAGASPGIHPNGLIYVLSLPALAFFAPLPARRGLREGGWYVLGAAVGAVVWTLTSRWDDFLISWKIWGWNYRLPLLSGDVAANLAAGVRAFFSPEKVYNTEETFFYRPGLRLEYGVLFLGLGLLIREGRRDRFAAGLSMVAILLVFWMSQLVAHKNPSYLVTILPFLGLAAVVAFAKAFNRAGRVREAAVGAALLFLGMAAFNGFSYQAAQFARVTRYEKTCREFRRYIPPGARVLGPGQFWLEFRDGDFRDSNVLIFEYWLTNAVSHIIPAVRRHRPDFIVADLTLFRKMERAGWDGFRAWARPALIARVDGETEGKSYLLIRMDPPAPPPTGPSGREGRFGGEKGVEAEAPRP